MKEKVLEFIKRRFPVDCNWTTGNCYYFAQILLARFPIGKVYYDPINGHFIFGYHGEYFDYNGEVSVDNTSLIEWDFFIDYDFAQYQRIVRDCII